MKLTQRAGKRARASPIGFGFSSDWSRKWCDIFKPLTKRSNAKPKQMQITFDTRALNLPLIVKVTSTTRFEIKQNGLV